MDSLAQFVERMNSKIGIVLPDQWQTLSDRETAQHFLQSVNQFFFQTHEGLGTTEFKGESLQYFSEFHKYWEANHQAILNGRIDRSQAKLAATAFSSAIHRYGEGILNLTHDTCGLSPQAIAQVRYFTANQDFREPPENQYGRYIADPTRFDAREISDNPTDFLKFLGMTRLSQTDKRLDFARNAARFLLEMDTTAFGLARSLSNSAVQVRDALVTASNIGYGLKKANMFIRDMVELGVWPDLERFDEVDVASDINTMKLALRARIVQTDIPLLSSFLDIFCHQYGYVDKLSAMAWRAVWEEWQELDVSTAPRSPCLIDFLLYRMGREYCKSNLVRFECEAGHSFYHFGARLRKCRVCSSRERAGACPISRQLPCQIDWDKLPRENGRLLLSDKNLLSTFNGICILEVACQPRTEVFRQLDPPKSISIKGRTSWTSAYADRARGGGGMMG